MSYTPGFRLALDQTKVPSRSASGVLTTDYSWADFSNKALWRALLASCSASSSDKLTQLAAAATAADRKLEHADFDGLGVFAALASAERRSDDAVELNLPAPAAYQLSAAQLQRGELRITLSAADAPPLLARLQLPATKRCRRAEQIVHPARALDGSRTRLADDVVNVGAAWPLPGGRWVAASAWAVPASVQLAISREDRLRRYRAYLEANRELRWRLIGELAGKRLCCSCGDREMCHANVLLELLAAALQAERNKQALGVY